METKLYNGDCLVEMAKIPDKSVDMILCDLPYGVLHKDNPFAQWDRELPFDQLWADYLRIIKDNGAVILFGSGMFTARMMMSQPKYWRYNLVWNKMRATGFLNANRMPLRYHEDICVFYKEMPTYNPQMERLNGREPSHPQGDGKHNDKNQCYGEVKRIYRKKPETVYEPVRRVEPTADPNLKFPGSIISIRKEHEHTTQHPTQKPVDLCRYLIRTYTNEGDTVLDNTMGSGTTGVACVKEKRNFIGIELNEEYFNIAQERIEIAQSQLTLF